MLGGRCRVLDLGGVDAVMTERDKLIKKLIALAHKNTDLLTSKRAAMYVDAILSARPELGVIDVSILTMKLSGDREEYYTRITCDGRTFDVRKYGQNFRNRAEYECAELRHVLLGEPKPDLMAPQYADLKEVLRLLG